MFRIGDKVRIRKDSDYYGNGRSNPKGTVGVIHLDQRDREYSYSVDWLNGYLNSYREYDLELAEEILYETGCL